jgi:hypothetical protein
MKLPSRKLKVGVLQKNEIDTNGIDNYIKNEKDSYNSFNRPFDC